MRLALHRSEPSPREVDILKVPWISGRSSVRTVHQGLKPALGLAFNTVQTLLRIMEKKGLVAHRAEGRKFVYRALCGRERLAADFLRKVFDGSFTDLVATLLRLGNADPKTLMELRQLIDEAFLKAHRRGEQR
jgi:BlaI family penicillinase repressor